MASFAHHPVRLLRSLALGSLLLISLAARARAGEIAGQWIGDFGIPSFDGRTAAAAVFQGQFVVAGDFRWAAATRATNVAIWTGTEWEQAGAGLPAFVRRLAVQGATLLAGTDSFSPGSAPVMQFDGVAWHPLGTNLFGETDALLVDGPYVYAAGFLALSNEPTGTTYRVVRWSGATWEAVGGTFDSRVRALAMFDGSLYAGGEFLSGDIGYVSRIARFDGAHWQSVGGGTNAGGTSQPYVAALAVHAGRLIAGGGFDAMGGEAANGIAAWDGAAWSALPNTPTDVYVSDLQSEGASLHVAGTLQIPAVWGAGLVTFDGQNWTPPSSYPDWGIEDIAIGDGMLIAVGGQTQLVQQGGGAPFDNMSRNVLVRDPSWHDLVAWKSTMRGLRGPGWTAVQSLHVHDGSLFAAGYFAQAADPPGWQPAMGVARWDGDGWRALPGGLYGWVWKLASWNGLLVAGGYGMGSPSGYSSVLGWNGTDWSVLGAPIEGYVAGLAVWQGQLVAVGSLNLPGETARYGVMIHGASGWTPLGSPLLGTQTYIQAVATFGGELYVGGYAIDVPGQGSKSIVRWNGSSWLEVPGSPHQYVSCLRVRAEGLWAGGGPAPGTRGGGNVWRWNGLNWANCGELLGSVYDLADLNGEAYAGGNLYASGSNSTLARWNGKEWEGVSNSPNRHITALAQLDGDLFVGGDFTRLGDRPAEAIARWTPPAGIGIVRAPLALSVGPNPASDLVNFRFTLARAGRVQLSIYDLRGSLIARPIDEELAAGTVEREWWVRGSLRGAPRPGVYFAKLVSPQGEARTRVVLVP